MTRLANQTVAHLNEHQGELKSFYETLRSLSEKPRKSPSLELPHYNETKKKTIRSRSEKCLTDTTYSIWPLNPSPRSATRLSPATACGSDEYSRKSNTPQSSDAFSFFSFDADGATRNNPWHDQAHATVQKSGHTGLDGEGDFSAAQVQISTRLAASSSSSLSASPLAPLAVSLIDRVEDLDDWWHLMFDSPKASVQHACLAPRTAAPADTQPVSCSLHPDREESGVYGGIVTVEILLGQFLSVGKYSTARPIAIHSVRRKSITSGEAGRQKLPSFAGSAHRSIVGGGIHPRSPPVNQRKKKNPTGGSRAQNAVNQPEEEQSERAKMAVFRAASDLPKHMLPGPYPKTPEERAAAAKKYNMILEDYEPYPDDGWGNGDYPMLPNRSQHERDPYYEWDNTQMRRNWGEPCCTINDIVMSAYAHYMLLNKGFKADGGGKMLKKLKVTVNASSGSTCENVQQIHQLSH
ncbi:hypothetical protein DNTS_009015 [Danionella cerebrum]|uniref:Uncharacterized protein n=1 Tax=Danionella cerebrum TaxID=2873325 RepID=A0A553QAD6_9TELE|nr:hypothetical protein DNTS_009015 [Danionella translucida]